MTDLRVFSAQFYNTNGDVAKEKLKVQTMGDQTESLIYQVDKTNEDIAKKKRGGPKYGITKRNSQFTRPKNAGVSMSTL